MPWALKQQILWIVRDFERTKREYRRERLEIIEAGGDRAETYTVNGEERRIYMPSGHNASRTTEDRQMQLAALEMRPAYRQMHAVEHARDRVGAELPDMLRDQLREAIMLSCTDGRRYPFERLFIAGISRTEFYRFRDEMLKAIARELGLI